MKTRYVVLRTSKYFIVRCLFKFMRRCFVLLEIHTYFKFSFEKLHLVVLFLLRQESKFGKHSNRLYSGQCDISSTLLKKTLWLLFIDRAQLPKVYRANTKRKFTFYHSVSRNSWYPFDQPQKDERLTQPWRHTVASAP